MDETDSGLDIDALRTVANAVNAMRGPDLGVLIITHYQRILSYIKPDFVHIMLNGRIVEEGGSELAAAAGAEGLRLGARAHPRRRPRPRWRSPPHRRRLPQPVEEIRADFPILAREVERQAARLPRQRRDLAEAGGGDRGDRLLLPQLERERPPQHARAGGRGRARSTRAAGAKVAELIGAPSERDRSSSATRPRRSTSCASPGRARTSAPATSC